MTPKFKIGDRVSFVDNVRGGSTGTIIEVGGEPRVSSGGYFVLVDNGVELGYENFYYQGKGVWYFYEKALTLIEPISVIAPKTQVYNDILGYKVVVIPHLKQVRLFTHNKEVVKVELSSDEATPFDPVYGFLMAYAKYNTGSNTRLQTELEKLRHDPVRDPKVKKVVDDPVVWISVANNKIRLSDLKGLTTGYIVNIVNMILRKGLSPSKDFDIENTYYILMEAKRRGELKHVTYPQFVASLLPF